MVLITRRPSPLGDITLAAEGDALVGLWFDKQKYHGSTLPENAFREGNHPVFAQAERWLDIYFSGREPDFTPPLDLRGSFFQKAVWELLLSIPYGCTLTYGAAAALLTERQGRRADPRAVGGAAGRNPISLIVPCHRLIGADGSLTGYAGGLERKRALLTLEGIVLRGKG